MNSSLKKLVKNLLDNDFKYLTEEFGSKNLELLKQKDAYPYEYMDSFKRFNEEKLPDKKCFYSSVKDGTTDDNGEKLDGHISNEDYLTCKKIWNEFNMKNMGDYHDHYLKKDVLLLADVFEKFIDTCLKFYGLDPCHYFSSPGLSWDAMLKMTGMRLKKMCILTCTYSMKKDYEEEFLTLLKDTVKQIKKKPKKPSKFITQLDMNNLYGWAMSSCFPHGGFKYLKNVDNFDVKSISENSLIRYILEVDLEYPEKLHVSYNDYPLAPENLAIPYEILSGYCKKLVDEYEIKVGEVKKII